MDWVTLLTTAMTVAAPLVLGYVVLVLVPSVQHSHFRHQLWELRDDLVDDLLRGRAKRDLHFQVLIDLVDVGLHDAGRHTLAAAWVARRRSRGLIPPGAVEDMVLGGDGGPQREILAEYLARYRRISRRHLYSGAPSGWAVWIGERVVRQADRIDRAVREAVDREIAQAPARKQEMRALASPAAVSH